MSSAVKSEGRRRGAVRRAYFADRNYAALYVNAFGTAAASHLAGIFTGVYFYTLGMPVHFIFLFWGLEFGLRGALSPLSPALLSRFGLAKTIYLSYAALVVYFVLVGASPRSLAAGFFAFPLHSFSMALYYPCVDAMHAVCVADDGRGRQMSAEMVLVVVANLAAVGLGTLVLSSYPFAVLVAAAALLLALAAAAAARLDHGGPPPVRFGDSYRYLASSEFRPYLPTGAAYALAIIANVVVTPLYLFVRVGRVETWGVVMGAATAVELVVLLAAGRAADRWRGPGSFSLLSGLLAAGNAAYLLLGAGASGALLAGGYNSNLWHAFMTNVETRFQRAAFASASPFLFAAAQQMALCFTEIVALSLLAAVAWWEPDAAFALVFLGSAAALWCVGRFGFGGGRGAEGVEPSREVRNVE